MSGAMGVEDLGGAPLTVALRLAHEAGELARNMAVDGIKGSRKADKSVVTEADLAADHLIRAGLLEAFPDAAILSEEIGGTRLQGARRIWVVDPIDGTKAFVANRPGWCVMIGMLEDGEPAMGVVYDPVEDRCFHAITGRGAFVRQGREGAPVRVQVSERDRIEDMRLITTPSFKEHRRAALIEKVGFQDGPVINSVGIKVGLLALNQGDLYFSHHGLSYWDTVAPLCIAAEAGARATQLSGDVLRYNPDRPSGGLSHDAPLIVTNGRCHEELCVRINAALESGV